MVNDVFKTTEEKMKATARSFHTDLATIRTGHATPALVEGDYRPVHETSQEVLAFLRSTSDQEVLVLLNFSEKQISLDFSDLGAKSVRVIYSAILQATTDFPQLTMNPFEIWIAELK